MRSSERRTRLADRGDGTLPHDRERHCDRAGDQERAAHDVRVRQPSSIGGPQKGVQNRLREQERREARNRLPANAELEQLQRDEPRYRDADSPGDLTPVHGDPEYRQCQRQHEEHTQR